MKKPKREPTYLHPFDPSDPVPMQSSVVFKRPLSAHERVLRAIKTHSALERMNAAPGDESFDDPEVEGMTPHQLMHDPISGEEMTAGEYVMLQHERDQARADVAQSLSRREKKKNQKKLEAPAAPKSEEENSED